MSNQHDPLEPTEDQQKFIEEYHAQEASEDERLGMKVRLKVIRTALQIEMMATHVLGVMLGIDPTKSKVIGMRGSPMSFKQKVDLMVEVAALDKVDVRMFQVFMEIRNTFAHDIRAKSILDCFNALDERDGRAARKYVIGIVDDPYWTKLEGITLTEEMKLDVGVELLRLKVWGRSRYAFKMSEERHAAKAGAILGSEAYRIFADEHHKAFTDLLERLYWSKGKLILTDTVAEEVEKLSAKQWELMNETWKRVDPDKVAKFMYPAHEPNPKTDQPPPSADPPTTI
jgi:hypothetical protein